MSTGAEVPVGPVVVRSLLGSEVAEADRILRLAFGTFVGLADPMEYLGDAELVRPRFLAESGTALAAEVDGVLVGTNFITRWGSVGFFGPLTVDPARWHQGVARALLDATVGILDGWGVSHRGLFTFAHSPAHVALYQRYGFSPRMLTVVASKTPARRGVGWLRFSQVRDTAGTVERASALTNAVYSGLDVSWEMVAAAELGLGDCVLLPDSSGDSLAAFAVCHVGAGSEAGSGNCYVKFAAARPGHDAPSLFADLLDAVESFAVAAGAARVTAGVSTGRRGAYRLLLERGYRIGRVGVTMHAPDEDAYHHPGAYVLDDWR